MTDEVTPRKLAIKLERPAVQAGSDWLYTAPTSDPVLQACVICGQTFYQDQHSTPLWCADLMAAQVERGSPPWLVVGEVCGACLVSQRTAARRAFETYLRLAALAFDAELEGSEQKPPHGAIEHYHHTAHLLLEAKIESWPDPISQVKSAELKAHFWDAVRRAEQDIRQGEQPDDRPGAPPSVPVIADDEPDSESGESAPQPDKPAARKPDTGPLSLAAAPTDDLTLRVDKKPASQPMLVPVAVLAASASARKVAPPPTAVLRPDAAA